MIYVYLFICLFVQILTTICIWLSQYTCPIVGNGLVGASFRLKHVYPVYSFENGLDSKLINQ